MNISNQNTVSQEEKQLIERFITAFNKIEHILRAELKADSYTPFKNLVSQYREKNQRWASLKVLPMMADLRNAIIHQHTDINTYLSVPILSVVEQLEGIRDEFLYPVLVIPQFQRVVTIFDESDTLLNVLETINEKNFSQFPIYNDDKFVGLLTENGITRWLAHHSQAFNSLIETEDIKISDILAEEENRKNCEFISRKMPLLKAENMFVQNPMLEALIITQNGKSNEKPLGIITLWDIIRE